MAVFELGGALAQALPDLGLGPWTRTAPGLMAFDARSDQPESLWRVDLAHDGAASRDALADGERSIARTHAALEHAPRRLDQTLGELVRAARTAQVSGDRGPTERLGDVPRLEADTPGELAQALSRIADLVRGRVRIETRVDAALAACSITTLSGDTELWTAPSLSPASVALHTRSVAVALRTRHAWARTLALIVAYGGRFAALNLHAGVTALPLVWRLVRDVLREVRQLDAPPAPGASQTG
jgi:hypothetical protein